MFRTPQHQRKTLYQAGEQFQFELLLFGRAVESLPYFVLAFRDLALGGMGLNRAQCILEGVKELSLDRETEREIYHGTEGILHTAEGVAAERWVEFRKGQLGDLGNGKQLRALSIQFLSPTFLRADGKIIERPEFSHVFKRARDRINALCAFFGEGSLEVDFRSLGEQSERVQTVAAQVRWEERARTSSRTRQRHTLSGLVGRASYTGNVEEFLPWLLLAELVHVGKHATWGNGQIRVDTFESCENNA